MTPTEKGRFCAQCQKQVVDFTSMSDRQLAEFFKKPSSGSSCGRFLQEQLDRAVEIPRKRIPWIKYFFQFTLPAFLLSLKTAVTNGQANRQEVRNTFSDKKRQKDEVKELPEVVITGITKPPAIDSSAKKITIPFAGPPIPYRNVTPLLIVKPLSLDHIRKVPITTEHQNIPEKDSSIFLFEGIVEDNKGNKIHYASVRIKGTKTGVLTDTAGKFRIAVRKGYVLVISCVGFEATEIPVSSQIGKTIRVQQAAITLNSVTLGGFSYIKKTKKRKKEPKATKAPQQCVDEKLIVYPNPVKSGGAINIKGAQLKEGTYTFSLYNLAGELIIQKDVVVDIQGLPVNMIIPATPPGYYIVNLLHHVSKRNYSVNILIN